MNQPEENITQLNEAVQAAHLGHMLLFSVSSQNTHFTPHYTDLTSYLNAHNYMLECVSYYTSWRLFDLMFSVSLSVL